MTFYELLKINESRILNKSCHYGKERMNIIFDNLGSKEISDIVPYEIIEVNSKIMSISSLVTAEKYYALIKKVFYVAEKEGYIKRNPTKNIKLPKRKEYIYNTKMTELQRKEMLILIESSQFKTILQIISITGLALNKVRCLYWDDIDFTNNELVVKYVVDGKTLDSTERVLLPLKKQRKIRIPSFIMKNLMELYEIQIEKIRKIILFPNLHRLIFTNNNNKMYSCEAVNNEIKKIGRAIGIENLTSDIIAKDSVYQAMEMGVSIRDIMSFYNLGDGNKMIARMYRELRMRNINT